MAPFASFLSFLMNFYAADNVILTHGQNKSRWLIKIKMPMRQHSIPAEDGAFDWNILNPARRERATFSTAK